MAQPFQFSNTFSNQVPFFIKDGVTGKIKNKSSLPKSYTDIQPTKESKTENPSKNVI